MWRWGWSRPWTSRRRCCRCWWPTTGPCAHRGDRGRHWGRRWRPRPRRRPAPGFVAIPRPSTRRTPRPMPIAIRRPIAVIGKHGRAWLPDPAEVVRIHPIAVSIEILCAPNVFVVVANVEFETLSQVLLTLVHPVVNGVARCGSMEFPIAGVFTGNHEFSRAAVAQVKTGSVGIDAGAASVAHG